MARKTKAEAEQTRLRILRAALSLFAEKGYERTTFEDVARRIRLSKGAVYWHLKSKPDLLSALVAWMSAR
ncbi:MAG: TetR family transcriptional regulator, partial [Kiritimatiellae bacterium]|nr:TetR family transcriptional regulator [Kiritimatiellia bacterium]